MSKKQHTYIPMESTMHHHPADLAARPSSMHRTGLTRPVSVEQITEPKPKPSAHRHPTCECLTSLPGCKWQGCKAAPAPWGEVHQTCRVWGGRWGVRSCSRAATQDSKV